MKDIIALDNVLTQNYQQVFSNFLPENDYVINISDLGASEWAYCGNDLLDFFEKLVVSCGYYFYISMDPISSSAFLQSIWQLPETVKIAILSKDLPYFKGQIICVNGCPCSFYGQNPQVSDFYFLACPASLVTPALEVVPSNLEFSDFLRRIKVLKKEDN